MELVALLSQDNAPPAPITGPPGLTPAQIAMRQRMLAMQARRMGVANPAATGQVQGVRRGPSIRLCIWRLGSAPSSVWDVTIQPPPPPAPLPRDAVESVSVLGLCWSPDGERLAVRISITRVVHNTPQHGTALLTYSVFDGAVLHTLYTPCSDAPLHCAMQWIPLPNCSPKSQALDMLAHLAPLMPIQDFSGEKSRWVGSTQRHKPAGEPPSADRVHGKGVLASVPVFLANDEPISLLLCAEDCMLHAWLNGSVPLASTHTSHRILSVAASEGHASVLVDASRHTTTFLQIEHIPLPWDAATVHLARLSTAFSTCLAHALDAAFYASHAWTSYVRPRASEWHDYWDDLARKHGVDIVMEWMTLLTTAHASPACEQLLAQLTEGTMIAMETDMKRGLKWIRRLASTGIVPACERMLIVLNEWHGCTAWSTRYPPGSSQLAPLMKNIQSCHGVALALHEQVERELLALDEFYKWWRMEQDRQERLKCGDISPAVVVHHDTLSVLELCQRGFIAPELDVLLGVPSTPTASVHGSSGASAANASSNNGDVDEDESQSNVHANMEPLFQLPTVSYESEAGIGFDPCIPAAHSLATVEEALAWLDTDPPLCATHPTDDQWRYVFHSPMLFPGPASTCRPRALPGDACTLLERFEHVGAEAARIMSEALMHTNVESRPCGDAWSVPSTLLQRDDALRSVPSDSPSSIVAHSQRPVTRACARSARAHVHMYICESQVCTAHVNLSSMSCCVQTTQVPLPHRVLDGAVTPQHVHLLYQASRDDEETTRVGVWHLTDAAAASTAVPATTTPLSWPPSHATTKSYGSSVAASARGTSFVVSMDRRTLSTYKPPVHMC